jgi:hypothetical protein
VWRTRVSRSDLYVRLSGPRQQELLKRVFDAIVFGPEGLVE